MRPSQIPVETGEIGLRIMFQAEWRTFAASCCVYASTMLEVQGLPSFDQHARDGSC